MIHSCFVNLLKQNWFWNHTFPEYRTKKLDAYACVLADALHKEPRQEICEVQKNPYVLLARNLLRNLMVDAPYIQALKSELIAIKLGIKRSVFENNPGFEKFATENHLERYLLAYENKIVVKTENIFLKVNIDDSAREKSWEEVQKILFGFKKISIVPSQPWFYGPLGLQNKDMYDWDELQPFKWEDAATWKTQYIFETCVFLTGSPLSLTGNHSWLRLRTPAGMVYSVGLYCTGKHGEHQHANLPLRIMSSELMSPDVSEFWPTKGKEALHSWQFAITRKAFFEIKTTIESEKREGIQPFEDFDLNCMKWVVEKAKIAGITLQATENIVSLFVSRKVERIARSMWEYVPMKNAIGSVLSVPVVFGINTFQLMLGAGCVDPKLRKVKDAKPRIVNWKDLFDPQKMTIYHPYTFVDKVIPAIEKWRIRERECILKGKPQDMEKELSKIDYRVPDEAKKL